MVDNNTPVTPDNDDDNSIVPAFDANLLKSLGLTLGEDTFLSINDETLTKIVNLELDAQIGADAEFSTWNITENLRLSYPLLNIVQGRVRNVVAAEMADRISNGLDYTDRYDHNLGTQGARVWYKNIPTITIASDDDDDDDNTVSKAARIINKLFNWGKK